MVSVCGRNVVIRGGLLRVAQLEGDSYEFTDNPAELVRGLSDGGHSADLFTFVQMEMDNYAGQEIVSFDHWWNKKMGFKARNKAKQAEKKGVILRETPFGDELSEGIWKIYNETPIRQGRKFGHYGKDRSQVYREEATFLDRSVFVGAYFEEELIGFIKLVADETNTQAGLMNIVSMIAHRDKAPTNALVAQAARICAERGIR